MLTSRNFLFLVVRFYYPHFIKILFFLMIYLSISKLFILIFLLKNEQDKGLVLKCLRAVISEVCKVIQPHEIPEQAFYYLIPQSIFVI